MPIVFVIIIGAVVGLIATAIEALLFKWLVRFTGLNYYPDFSQAFAFVVIVNLFLAGIKVATNRRN